MLTILSEIPDGLLSAKTEELADLLPGPVLIHLSGRCAEPVFVSVLSHGNEDGGFYAMQSLLRAYRGRELPRALSLFIGNVTAARHGLRRLDGQPDYNRIWPGGDGGGTPEHAMMDHVVRDLEARRVFVSADLHNNTGINPHYACINRIDSDFLHLATLYSRTVVYFTRPLGVQSMAFASLCPAVTMECGQPGEARGVDHAREFVEACLHLKSFPDHQVLSQDVDLFHSVATVKVPESFSFSFKDDGTDIRFVDDLDHFNFRELPKGTILGRIRPASGVHLEIWDETGQEVSAHYCRIEDNEIRTTRPVMPAMFTLNERVIRQDCLGYFMERYPLPK
ncbi:MAG: M14 family metallopeptidase [Gammaproteobacteria bacterium]